MATGFSAFLGCKTAGLRVTYSRSASARAPDRPRWSRERPTCGYGLVAVIFAFRRKRKGRPWFPLRAASGMLVKASVIALLVDATATVVVWSLRRGRRRRYAS
uniref:Uncharacterized protein n=1 Tax=Oryza sativa subsp. japonica TaxID=39947 RepID=Q8LN64_ORYSJ|nr:hypothetical protein [Oryza sativa Japonica Group]